jgi:hypothetical protein
LGVKFNPVRGISSAGRALAWHARGQGFKSPILHFLSPSEIRICGEEFGVQFGYNAWGIILGTNRCGSCTKKALVNQGFFSCQPGSGGGLPASTLPIRPIAWRWIAEGLSGPRVLVTSSPGGKRLSAWSDTFESIAGDDHVAPLEIDPDIVAIQSLGGDRRSARSDERVDAEMTIRDSDECGLAWSPVSDQIGMAL